MKVGLLAMLGMLGVMVVVCDVEIERLVKTLRYYDTLEEMKPMHVEDNSERNKFQPW